MKKTLTVTFHSAINYGAILQTIALQKTLENNSIKNEIIDYTPSCFNFYNPFSFKNLSFTEIMKKNIKNILYWYRIFPKYFKFKKFIKNNIKTTKHIKDIDGIKNLIECNDILITGSDQVWSTNVTKELSDVYTLNFNNINNKRISYAASIGSSNIPKKFEKDYLTKISKIDHISVREVSAKKELKRIGILQDIDVVLDPTFLLKKDEWLNLISKERLVKQKYILAYTMEDNNEYIKIVNELSKKTGLKVIYLDYRNIGFNNVLKNFYTANPYEFLNLIYFAEYIVTTSFHGTVFSVIFEKKFWCCPHSVTGGRVTNILNKLSLCDRIVSNYDSFTKTDYNKEINYLNTKKVLDREIEKSTSWIITNINK